jgi:Tfp pilus assembly protein FimT
MALAWPAGRRKLAGVTLVELAVVMAIIAIVFFAAQPAFMGVLRSSEKKAALRELAGLLTCARTEAVATGRLVRVNCDLNEGVFWAEAQVDPQRARSQFALLPTLGRSAVRVPESLAVSELTVVGQLTGDQGGAEIYFYPDGRTDGVSLTLADEAGRETVIRLSPATGRVTVGA